MKIAVVDFQRVMRESAAAKSVRPQVEKLRDGFVDDLKEKQEELKGKEKELVGLQTILSPEKLEEKKRELRKEVADANDELKGRREVLDQALRSAQLKIEEAFQQVAAELAQEQGYALILRRAATVLSVRQMDITDEVLKRLDKKLPSVAVNVPRGN